MTMDGFLPFLAGQSAKFLSANVYTTNKRLTCQESIFDSTGRPGLPVAASDLS